MHKYMFFKLTFYHFLKVGYDIICVGMCAYANIFKITFLPLFSRLDIVR